MPTHVRRIPRNSFIFIGIIFALATPAGIVAGASATETSTDDDHVSSGLVAMAGGSFTFVSLAEVLPREMKMRCVTDKASKWLAFLLGFCAMAILALWL